MNNRANLIDRFKRESDLDEDSLQKLITYLRTRSGALATLGDAAGVHNLTNSRRRSTNKQSLTPLSNNQKYQLMSLIHQSYNGNNFQGPNCRKRLSEVSKNLSKRPVADPLFVYRVGRYLNANGRVKIKRGLVKGETPYWKDEMAQKLEKPIPREKWLIVQDSATIKRESMQEIKTKGFYVVPQNKINTYLNHPRFKPIIDRLIHASNKKDNGEFSRDAVFLVGKKPW